MNRIDEEAQASADDRRDRTPPKPGRARPPPETDEELPLPSGWHRAKGNEEAKGAFYYWHDSDPEGTTTWIHPASAKSAKQRNLHKSLCASWTPKETRGFLARCGLAAAAGDDSDCPPGFVSVDVLLGALGEATSFDREARSKLRSECEAALRPRVFDETGRH